MFFLTLSSEERQKRNTGTADIHNVLISIDPYDRQTCYRMNSFEVHQLFLQ